MKWQPIDTAPSGEWVIVYYDDPMGVSIAEYAKNLEVWQDWDGDLYGTPTHWMPLPEAPEDA
jgi:hypothetical protein